MSSANIIIFRCELMDWSETFIYAQSGHLRRYVPNYLGVRSLGQLPPPPGPCLIVNRGGWLGGLRENAFKVWNVMPGLYGQLKRLRPALIHAHFGPDGASAVPLAGHLNVPLIVTFHGYDTAINRRNFSRYDYITRAYVRRQGRLKRKGRVFIAVSESIKKRLLEQGFPPDSVIVHYIGVDTDFFRPAAAVRREPFVLFTGRLVEKKGCEYLIKAMSGVQAARPETRLVIAGDGALRPSLERQAERTLRNYTFLGMQTRAEVRALMNRAKVFCVPSISSNPDGAEGFGMVFAEAQAMGLPVVSFNSGGVPEAVAHGETGFLAEEGDWEALAGNILHLMEDGQLWRRFSGNGQVRIRRHFDLARQTVLLENIYDGVRKGFPQGKQR